MARKRNCVCCDFEYEYCSNCNDHKSYPTWMTEFCSESCKEVFNIVSAYNMNLVDAKAVKEIVDKYNITDFKKYKKTIADKLTEACNKAKKEEVIEAEEENKKSFEKNSFKYKKNYKDIANTEE